MDKAKEMVLADALAEAITKTRETIKLKRALVISMAINIALAVLLVIAMF